MSEGTRGWCLAVGRAAPHYVAEIVPNVDGLALCAACRLRLVRLRDDRR